MPHGRILQPDPQVVRPNQARRTTTGQGGGDVKLGRAPAWKLARAERSRLCIYAFVEKGKIDQGSNNRIGPIANTCDLETRRLFNISSAKRVDEYSRLPVKMELDLVPGDSRGYWKYHTPGK